MSISTFGIEAETINHVGRTVVWLSAAGTCSRTCGSQIIPTIRTEFVPRESISAL